MEKNRKRIWINRITLLIVILALMTCAATYGAIASCKHSGGTFLPNYECIDMDSTAYCVWEEHVYKNNGMNSVNLSDFLEENGVSS